MAQIVYRVSGQARTGKRARQTFRNTDEGREAARSFADPLRDVRTVYDVRTRVGGRVVTKTFTRRKDADEYATKLAHEQLTGYSIDPAGGRLTFEELSKRWIASNPGKRKSTIGRDQSALDAQILPVLGQKQLRAIRQADVQALVNDMVAAGLAPKRSSAPMARCGQQWPTPSVLT